MKTIICYATKTGTTETAAKELAGLLGAIKVCNLEKETPDIHNFDLVIIGGSIRMGKLHKAAKKFIDANTKELLSKKCAFFICNGFPEQAETFLIQNIGQELLSHSICAASFGGELDLSKLKGMDKFIAKAVTSSMKDNPQAVPKLLHESIKEFAKTVKAEQ
ncbi:MAG: flavodoxin domain-containing protein [Lachnospiraceae bacterium]